MSHVGGVQKPRSHPARTKRAGSDATAQRIAAALHEHDDMSDHDLAHAMQGKVSDEGATTGTVTPRSVGTGATASGKSSAGHKATTPVGSDDGGGSGGGGSSRDKRQVHGITAGGAGASRKELAEMPTARVKRILANRQSAARSKERKLAYIGELEGQVSTLTMQLTSASMQLRSLQQDTASLGECNQALAQQALVLREHMAQRDSETAMLASELRRAQALLAAHNIPTSNGGFAATAGLHPGPRGDGDDRRSPYAVADARSSPTNATASATLGHGQETFQLPDGFRIPEGFRPPSGGRGSDEGHHRAQLQVLERHQAQQRLWANSLGSAADNSLGDGASPRGDDAAALQQQLAAAAAAGRLFGAAGSASFLPGGLGAGLGSFNSGVSTTRSLASLSGGGHSAGGLGPVSARQRAAARTSNEQLDTVLAGYGMQGGGGGGGGAADRSPGAGYFPPGS